jgi:hypothetical protein
VKKLVDGKQRSILATLYLNLNTRFSAPLRKEGIPNRQARDMVALVALIITNHHRNKVTTAREIEQALGLPRATVERRIKQLKKLNYLAGEGSGFYVSDAYAELQLLQGTELDEIEADIHRASTQLRELHNE